MKNTVSRVLPSTWLRPSASTSCCTKMYSYVFPLQTWTDTEVKIKHRKKKTLIFLRRCPRWVLTKKKEVGYAHPLMHQ